MANEAVIVQDLETAHLECTIANEASGTDVPKNTLMVFVTASANTITASSADNQQFAGILVAEKEGGDGSTRAAVNRHCVAALKLGTASTVIMGQPVKICGANLINAADDDTIEEKSQVIGMALKAGTASQTVAVLLGAY